jgi:hypothetical protein
MSSSYLCYVHAHSSATPQLRVVNVDAGQSLAEAIKAAQNEWPRFSLAEVFNTDDELMLRVLPRRASLAR